MPIGNKFLQYVGDNTNHELTTIDGKNTHDLSAIAIANGNFPHQNIESAKVTRKKKVKW